MTALFYDIFHTSYGWMGVLASPKGLRFTSLPQASPDQCVEGLGTEVDSAANTPDRFEGLAGRLRRYFEGGHVSFADEPLDMSDASPFQVAAWRACQSIPLGETRAYKWLAARAGSPNAPRAAGQCMARNRLPIIVPCHRVIASDGTLGGFGRDASQLDLKMRLLEMEAAHTASPNPRPTP
jgi:methylated-DNA-[protein]-cysteine S-methyltransferase